MSSSEYSKGLRASEITPLFQFFLAGILIGEALAIGQIIGALLNKHLVTLDLDISILSLSGLSAATCLIYAGSRSACMDAWKLIRSIRIDLLFCLSLGCYLSYSSNGLANDFYAKHLEKLTFTQLICLAASPVIIAWSVMIKAYLYTLKKEQHHPYFMNDRELEDPEDDLLDYKERADIFAERVLNGGSSESLVFGIDAPWGAGKSTFVNFCCKYWEQPSNKNPIIHRFEPLRYEEGVDLTEKFIDDLINTIQSQVFAPSLRPLLKRYENLIKDKKNASLLDIKRTLSLNNDTINSTLEEIEYVLNNLNRRIIVVVDDLDRLHWSSIKSILFSIKRSFSLPNLSYILCYDTSNINTTPENPDIEKTLEFLEKFVNIKTSLFLGAQELTDYIHQYFDQALNHSYSLSSDATEQLRSVIHELIILFEGKEFHLYTPFIGDIRKIKRFINTLILLDIDKTNFNETDFNKRDLLHLVLIFINYPPLFRKIYESETSQKSGTFSLIQQGDLKNSDFYQEYKETLSAHQKFLLEQLFEPHNRRPDSFGEMEWASRACFQDKRRPLEKYLYLIAKLSRPISWESYRFYANKKDELIKAENVNYYLTEISKNPPLNQEQGQEEFWRIVAKHLNSVNTDRSTSIINYLIDTLPQHSLLTAHGLSEFRSTSIRLITKLLDETITSTAKKNHPTLGPADLSIVNLIYGDKKTHNDGIIESLASDDRGALAIHDLIIFRHYCTIKTRPERLWRALALDGTERTTFKDSHDEMRNQARKLSQFVFNIFKNKYIKNKQDILSEIDVTNELIFFGAHTNLYNEENKSDSWTIKINATKAAIKHTIVRQFGNKIIGESGFYDESGTEDKDGISNEFSKYLFSVCFNPNTLQGYINFAEYLLTFTSKTSSDSNDSEPLSSLSSIQNNINMEDLKSYWIENHEKIRSALSEHSNRILYSTNSKSDFGNDLPPVYRALDRKFIFQ